MSALENDENQQKKQANKALSLGVLGGNGEDVSGRGLVTQA